MSDTQFQQQVLEALSLIQTDVSTLKTDVGTLKTDVGTLTSEFHEFKENQEKYNQYMEQKTDALWSLSNQAFSAITDMQRKADTTQKCIDDIHQETVSPWKRRQTKSLV